jgi:Spy/CpxP family protein refolding chaperone
MKKILLMCCLFIGFTAASFAQTKVAPDPEAKAKGLQKELKLTDKQTEKIAAIYQQSSEKFAKIKEKQHGDTNKMLTDIGPLRAETIKKIKGLLTPAQAAKYDKLVKQTGNSTLNSGWSGGWGASSES